MVCLGLIEYESQYVLMIQNASDGLFDSDRHSVNKVLVHFVNGIKQRFIGSAEYKLFLNLSLLMSFTECTPSTHCKRLQFDNALTVTVYVQSVMMQDI